MVRNFTYEALERGHIRLLRLLPARSANVSCELITVKLGSKSCPQFMAVSYCWEDQASYRPLFVDGHLLRITANAEAFLRQVQWAECSQNQMTERSGFLEATDLFWIDAICINQIDASERAAQVQMMKQIYETATYIAIWLGEPSKNTARAFEYLESRDSTANELTASEKQRSVAGLIEVLQRSYWSRSWVLQEATTPKAGECIAVLCGDLEIPFDRLLYLNADRLLSGAGSSQSDTDRKTVQRNDSRANPYLYGISKELSRMTNIDFVSVMSQVSKKMEKVDTGRLAATKRDLDIVMSDWETKHGYDISRTAHMMGVDLKGLLSNIFSTEMQPKLSQLSPPEDTSAQDKVALGLWEERIGPLQILCNRRRRSRRVNFYSLARLIRLQQASDPRDKLFAPLQLTTQVGDFLPSYERPAWVIYCEFAAAMIEADEQLDILSFGHVPIPSENVLPSWVPDWTRKYNFAPLPNVKEELSSEDDRTLDTILDSKDEIEDDIIDKLHGRISRFSEELTPAEFLRLHPTKRPRLIVCGIRIGYLKAKASFGRFSDLSEYFAGRVSFTFSQPIKEGDETKKKETAIFGDDTAKEDEILILAPETATIEDEVFYVFGARYPLILRREAERPFHRLSRSISNFFTSSSKSASRSRKSSGSHPDGLREYCFCGEAVSRAIPGSDDPRDEDWDRFRAWRTRETILSLFPWGQTPSYYRRILRRCEENWYRGVSISDQIVEIAIV